jgi:hypothetical protein
MTHGRRLPTLTPLAAAPRLPRLARASARALLAGALALPLAAAPLAAPSPALGQDGAMVNPFGSDDPFAVLRNVGGTAVATPPRALAVIPERHTGRLLKLTDVLAAVDPQFGDVARGAGLDGRRAIQLRTRDANMPVYVAKSESTIATVLQLEIGARIEIEGVLIERGGYYLLLARSVRPAPGAATAPAGGRPGGGAASAPTPPRPSR